MTRTETHDIDPYEAEGTRVPGASSGHAPLLVPDVAIADDTSRDDGEEDHGVQVDCGIFPRLLRMRLRVDFSPRDAIRAFTHRRVVTPNLLGRPLGLVPVAYLPRATQLRVEFVARELQ